MRGTLLLVVTALAACSGGGGGDPPAAVDALPDEGADAALDEGADDVGGDLGGDGGDDAADAPTTETAPPGATLRVVVLSDLNGSYGSTTYEANVHAAVKAITTTLKPDVVLVTGDMVAGQQAGLDYAAMWKGFHAAVTTPLTTAGVPVAITPGNHDASGYSAYAGERAEFVDQWSTRRPAVDFVDGSRWPLRYSFVHKGAFFVSLDATTVAPLSSEQRAWVDAQLAKASGYTVKIAFAHVPIHPVAVGRETEVTGDLELEKIFANRGLTLFVAGHHHAYYPGAAGGVRQIAMPCAGAGPRALIGTSTTSDKGLLRVDVKDGAVTAVEAIDGPTYTATIPRAGLPKKLTFGTHTLTRDDLAGF